MQGTFKNIKFIGYYKGVSQFLCSKGHKTNYVMGSGLIKNPFECPVCNGASKTIGNQLHKLNNQIKDGIK